MCQLYVIYALQQYSPCREVLVIACILVNHIFRICLLERLADTSTRCDCFSEVERDYGGQLDSFEEYASRQLEKPMDCELLSVSDFAIAMMCEPFDYRASVMRLLVDDAQATEIVLLKDHHGAEICHQGVIKVLSKARQLLQL
ncbi:hypothetical protein LTR81_023758 [Elasticomyces elasticus]